MQLMMYFMQLMMIPSELKLRLITQVEDDFLLFFMNFLLCFISIAFGEIFFPKLCVAEETEECRRWKTGDMKSFPFFILGWLVLKNTHNDTTVIDVICTCTAWWRAAHMHCSECSYMITWTLHLFICTVYSEKKNQNAKISSQHDSRKHLKQWAPYVKNEGKGKSYF